MKKGLLIVISAPSGTGKSTLVRRLCEAMPNLIHSISCTTRPKRSSEIDGRDYHFLSDEAFRRRRDAGDFVESAEVHGSWYGTLRQPLHDAVALGKSMILDIDIQGGMAMKAAFPEALTIFLLPPDLDELEERLRRRGTDDPRQVKLRLANAQRELAAQHAYDVRLVNDDLEKAVRELRRLIERAERSRH